MKQRIISALALVLLFSGVLQAQNKKGKDKSGDKAKQEAATGAGNVQVSYESDPASAEDPNHKCVTSIYQAILNTGDMVWIDGPSHLPQGVKIALIEGDPAKEGQFIIRLKVPAGYQLQPHSHNQIEHITVLMGNYKMAIGDKYDEAFLKTIKVGGVAVVPAKTQHFEYAAEETILQIHGYGPWDMQGGTAGSTPPPTGGGTPGKPSQ